MFLQYMESSETPNLLRVGREVQHECSELRPETMSVMDRLNAVSQIIQGMSDAKNAWTKAHSVKTSSIVPSMFDYLRWPQLDKVVRMNDGTICILPESLEKRDKSETSHKDVLFAAFYDDRSVKDAEVRAKVNRAIDTLPPAMDDFHEIRKSLRNIATLLLASSTAFEEKWGELFPEQMSVPYDDFVQRWNAEEDDASNVSRDVIDAIFIILNPAGTNPPSRPKEVTYELFCTAGKLYGTWWTNPMKKALMSLTRPDYTHFFILDWEEAENQLRRTPNLEYIIRPRCDPGSRSSPLPSKIMQPFAITVYTPSGVCDKYVIFYDKLARQFFTGTEDGRVYSDRNDWDGGIRGLCEKFMNKYYRKK